MSESKSGMPTVCQLSFQLVKIDWFRVAKWVLVSHNIHV